MGVIQGIRNPKSRTEVRQRDPQRTLEYLAPASLLMRRLDDAAVAGSHDVDQSVSRPSNQPTFR